MKASNIGYEEANLKKRLPVINTTHAIMLSFLCAIAIGSLLLSLPISSADGKCVSFTDALFTATTSVCVTGLVTVPTATSWSLFGQVVILFLIQTGGLGIITVMSAFMIALQKRMGIGDRLLLQDAFNLNSISGVVRFVKRVVIGSLMIEGAGALLYMTVFVPEFGSRGIWISVFNAVSAFCNAGMDIIGENSLCNYVYHPLVNAVTASLIIVGGIGFIVWWDFIGILKRIPRQRSRALRMLTLHSKIVLTTTIILITSGAVLFFIFEFDNTATVGDASIFEKITFSLFQSVTTRTAGFATVPQENLTDPSSMVSLFLMFIGGSPVGTAGGIKTLTFAILLAAAYSNIRGANSTVMFGRTISISDIIKAVTVVASSFAIVFISTVLLLAVTNASILDVVYETVSGTATVGLSRNLTSNLNNAGKAVMIATMYLGRIGPITLAIALNRKRSNPNVITNPTQEVCVG